MTTATKTESMWDRVLAFFETPSPLRSVIFLGLAFLPAAFLLVMILFLTVDAPFLDEWIWIPYIVKSYQGTLTFSDLWAQHNEHRPFFPKLITIALVRLTHWRTASLQAVAFTLATGILLLVWMRLRKLAARRFYDAPIGALPLLSLGAYSLIQWENFFMGIQFQEHLNVFSAVAGFMLLTGPRRTWFHFWAAAFMGLPATCSLANGLLYWPIALLLLYLFNPDPVRRIRECGLWGAMALGIGFAYFYGYQSPPYHPSPMLALHHPLMLFCYVLVAFGGPIAAYSPLAGMGGLVFSGSVGGGALLAHVVLLLLLVRRYGFRLRELSPFIAMALFAIASCVATGLGRLPFGLEQGMSPRYETSLNLLGFSDIALFSLYLGGVRKEWGKGIRLALIVAWISFAGLLALNSLYGAYRWSERYHDRKPAAAELKSGSNPDLLQRLFPEPNLVLSYREWLRAYKLSVFREE